MRLSVAVAVACLSCVGLSAAGEVQAAIRKDTSIPAQGLGPALQMIAKDRGFQVVYVSDEVNSLRTHGASGELTVEEALAKLLNGTGLTYKAFGENGFSIVSASAANTRSESTSSFSMGEERPAPGDRALARAGAPDGESAAAIEEIVVTAQKRSERLLEVPVPVTALSGSVLVNSNQLRLQDYFSTVPAFTVTPGVQSTTTLAIRGITTGQGTRPSVGITVDDAPFGSSTSNVIPDIDPGDLARVEVLRGPQGTLYGASSMGGLVKFVTLDPATDALTGRLQAGVSSVENGDEVGYNARASLNVPVSDVAALRASGFTRRDPGYIDDPALDAQGVNEITVSGGRLSALWQPSDTFSLKLGALYQKSEADGSSEVHRQPGLEDLEHRALRGSGWNDREIQVYSATATAQIGNGELIALTGYNINRAEDSFDASFLFGPFAQALFGVSGAETLVDYEAKRFTQELRFSTPIGKRLEWLFGAFYTDEDARSLTDVPAVDPVSGTAVGTILTTALPTTYREYAVFTDLTLQLTDRFDIQFGGRESRIEQTFSTTQSGITSPEVESEASVFTYLVTPRLRISPTLMLYARLASGYRPGGPNGAPGQGTPAEYEADETQNYELGLKGEFLDHALTVDASVYYIDWKDIQLALINPQTRLAYNTNGGRARSQGVELAVEARPVNGLSIAAWVAWSEAELAEDLPAASTVRAAEGDELPYSSRISGNFSVDQEFPLTVSMSGFVGGTLRYVDDRQGVFTASGLRQALPSYTQTDLRAGLRFYAWTASLFATNVTDQRGVLVGGVGALPPYGFTYIQPRTIGLSVTRTF